MDVHLDQCVADKVSEAAAIEVAVGAGVVFAVVDLRKLETAVLMKVFTMEILMGTEYLQKCSSDLINETGNHLKSWAVFLFCV